ncbi:MAG: hypothetical protein WEB00_15740 [Dehalococcoidia bacterium]
MRNATILLVAAAVGGLIGAGATIAGFLAFDDDREPAVERVVEAPEQVAPQEEVAFPASGALTEPTASGVPPETIEACSELPGDASNITYFEEMSLDGFRRRVVLVFGFDDGTGYALVVDELADLDGCDPHLLPLVAGRPVSYERVIAFANPSEGEIEESARTALADATRFESALDLMLFASGNTRVIVIQFEALDLLTFEDLRELLEDGNVLAALNVSERQLRQRAGLAPDAETADFDALLAASAEEPEHVPGYSFLWIKRGSVPAAWRAALSTSLSSSRVTSCSSKPLSTTIRAASLALRAHKL